MRAVAAKSMQRILARWAQKRDYERDKSLQVGKARLQTTWNRTHKESGKGCVESRHFNTVSRGWRLLGISARLEQYFLLDIASSRVQAVVPI